ncbi:MAG: MAPEG family protein [Steroidobacteraceae bacterium]|jgi:uncharacterized membrane protein YecN with MAPEG domain|nr:MAPEG family protein [Steroidobacteraceae bacterium]
MNGAITGLYAALTTFLLIVLGWRIAKLRMRHRVGLGDGGVPELQQAIRAHGNLVEYAPLALLLLLAAELGGAAPAPVLHSLGAAFVAARVAHAFGLSRSPGRSPGRFFGTLLTWLAMLTLAVLLLARAWSA